MTSGVILLAKIHHAKKNNIKHIFLHEQTYKEIKHELKNGFYDGIKVNIR